VLAIGVWAVTSAGRDQQDDKDLKEAKEAVTRVVNAMRKGGNAGPQAAEVAKKVDLENLMNTFKPRTKGGFGVGPKPGAITPDYIDKKITNMAKRALTPVQVAKQKEPLIEMAERAKGTGGDGLTVDTKGNLYITSQLGLQVFNPSGKLLGIIRIPEQPANVTFGGKDFKTLYVTARTSLYTIPMEATGHLFALPPK
jgi:hypothetical protein